MPSTTPRVQRGRSIRTQAKQRSKRLCLRPRTHASTTIPKPIDTQAVFPTLCAVCAQLQRIRQLHRRRNGPHPAHTESTDFPQGCPRGFHRLPTRDPHREPVTLQGDSDPFPHPQNLGTTPLTPGDNHGDNRPEMWMDRGRPETIHGPPEPSTDPPPGLSTRRRTRRPARTSSVHTTHSPYYCYCS